MAVTNGSRNYLEVV